MNYDCKALANLLFPDVTETVEDLEKKYPERDLKEGARVTRFAPSPTGYLHVGGARTAIYNYFFAKATGGTFYLRIEDTDRKRYNEEALKDLMCDLKWLGLQWDEGPGVEKDCGPYFQSERLDIYHREIKKLLDSGDAYYCFCTEERLNQVRAEQEKSGTSITGYDRHCRNISREEAENALIAGFFVL